MRSKKLSLESLNVESFETADAEGARGTVMAHDDSNSPNTGANSHCLCDPTDWGMCTLYEAGCTEPSGGGTDTWDYTCDRTY